MSFNPNDKTNKKVHLIPKAAHSSSWIRADIRIDI